jgi:hypothetical protein
MQLNIDGDLKKRTLTSGSLVAGSLTYNEAITGVDAVQVSLTCTIKCGGRSSSLALQI